MDKYEENLTRDLERLTQVAKNRPLTKLENRRMNFAFANVMLLATPMFPAQKKIDMKAWGSYDERMELANNESLRTDAKNLTENALATLWVLASDPETDVVEAVAPHLPIEIATALAEDPNPEKRALAALSGFAPIMKKLSTDNDSYVRTFVEKVTNAS